MLKKALAYDGLARGLHEVARAIEKGDAKLCVLAGEATGLSLVGCLSVMICLGILVARALSCITRASGCASMPMTTFTTATALLHTDAGP